MGDAKIKIRCKTSCIENGNVDLAKSVCVESWVIRVMAWIMKKWSRAVYVCVS